MKYNAGTKLSICFKSLKNYYFSSYVNHIPYTVECISNNRKRMYIIKY